MLNNLLLALEVTGIALLSAMIFVDLASAAKKRLSPVKIVIRNNRRRR